MGRATLATALRRIANALERGTDRDAVEMLTHLRDHIVALVRRAEPFTRGN